MKKLFFLLSCFLFLILFALCKKKDKADENHINPFQPFSYMPVYPSSYWKYVNQNGDTEISKTSDTYANIQGYYVTALDGQYIRGYSYWLDYGMIGGQGWFCFFSESVGYSWTNDINFMAVQRTEKFIVLKQTVDQYGDTCIIQRKYTKYQDSNGWYIWQKFKKNVGLVCEFSVDTITNDTTYGKVLVDYHINH